MRMPLLISLFFVACSSGGGGDGKGGGPGGGDGGDDTGDTGEPTPAEDPVLAMGLVPLPATVVPGDGELLLSATTTLRASGDATAIATLLAESLRTPTGLALTVGAGTAESGDISLVLDPTADLGDEAYTLSITAEGALLTAAQPAGLFYATQTLRQLLPAEAFSPASAADVAWVLPVVEIEDAPTYPWRGGMIDVARHFFDTAAVRRQIDLFALHKLNRMHLHLTDDQGWRIEIKSWPDLAIIGGVTEVGGGVGGYYTQDEYTALVDYAAARHVMIIPEIDFPGHAHAALTAYGVLNPSGEPEEPYTGAPVITTPLDLDRPETWDMVEDVWTEIGALTPGPYLHVGGDEAIDVNTAEYSIFIEWLQELVDDQDKLLIGWDEIGEAELSPPYVAQYWWQTDLAKDAGASGAYLIHSYASECYLDMVYDGDGEYGQVWAGWVGLKKAYSCRPGLGGVDPDRWLGVEGPLWTEYIADEDQMDFMLWPRLSAIAEVGWTPGAQLEWEGLTARLAHHGPRLEAIGVAFNATDDVDWD